MTSVVRTGPKPSKLNVTYFKSGGSASKKSKGSKICPAGKAWAKRTFDTYDHTNCYVYMEIHDLLKIFKHGYSKVTDHACREIRHGRLSRVEGVKIVKDLRFQKVQYLDLFLNWIGMTERGFNFILDQHRNSYFWKQDIQRKWQFIDPLENETEAEYIADIGFKSHFLRKYNHKKDNYITIGKGYP